jgi:hypothetical protein
MAHKKAKPHVQISGSSPSISLMVLGRQNLWHLVVYFGQPNKMCLTELHITGRGGCLQTEDDHG